MLHSKFVLRCGLNGPENFIRTVDKKKCPPLFRIEIQDKTWYATKTDREVGMNFFSNFGNLLAKFIKLAQQKMTENKTLINYFLVLTFSS